MLPCRCCHVPQGHLETTWVCRLQEQRPNRVEVSGKGRGLQSRVHRSAECELLSDSCEMSLPGVDGPSNWSFLAWACLRFLSFHFFFFFFQSEKHGHLLNQRSL